MSAPLDMFDLSSTFPVPILAMVFAAYLCPLLGYFSSHYNLVYFALNCVFISYFAGLSFVIFTCDPFPFYKFFTCDFFAQRQVVG